jgi:hypothetical protein
MTLRPERVLGPVLEVGAIAAYGCWAWSMHAGLSRAVWALGAMIVAATVWDAFQVPGDIGLRPVIAVPGWVRLTLEAAFFTGSVCAFASAGAPVLATCFGLLVGIHYALTHRRVVWLFREGQGEPEV